MSVFQPTHKLVAPAGEEIPVMLLSQKQSFRYLAVTAEEYEEGSAPIYEWHPSEGVTYRGFKLDGLSVLALDSRSKSLPQPASEPVEHAKQTEWA
ncbi:MAG: hypothetical protein KME26_33620 [Oscillatoria princeps RMCB-10]|nr:hypothetical protein [Oscillatoria princeps RMCB-10]